MGNKFMYAITTNWELRFSHVCTFTLDSLLAVYSSIYRKCRECLVLQQQQPKTQCNPTSGVGCMQILPLLDKADRLFSVDTRLRISSAREP